MRRTSRSALPALLLPALAACVLFLQCRLADPDRFEPVLNVQGYLPAGNARLLLVQVNRTYAITEPPSADFPGAAVTARRGGEAIAFAHIGRDQYRSTRPLDVRPGDRFDLEVAHPGFDTVRGRVERPDSFTLVTPRPGDTVTVRDSLVWTRSDRAGGYLVSIRDELADSLVFDFLYPNDTLPLNVPLFLLTRAPTGTYRFTVVALDTNYYDWLRRSLGGPGGRNTSDTWSVSGGVGVFGAGFERSLAVCYRCDTTGYRPEIEKSNSRKPRLPSSTRPWPATNSRSPSSAIPVGRASPASRR